MRRGFLDPVCQACKLQAPLPQKPKFPIKYPLIVLNCANEGMKQNGDWLARRAATPRAIEIVRFVGGMLRSD